MRLTKKDITNIYENKTFMLPRIAGKKLTAQILNEMVEYKTIEEELGIELVILFNALKNGIYHKWKYNGKIEAEKIKISYFDTSSLIQEKYYYDANERLKTHYYFDDYGKTWALTKGELEKNG